MSLPKSPWIVTIPRAGPARLRLFCFPYAGGTPAVFHNWRDGLKHVELNAALLPGHGSRFAEPPLNQMTEIVTGLADALESKLDGPFAFFGHSLGALVAFELVRELRRRRSPTPVLLLASASDAPQCARVDSPISHLPQAEFVAEMRKRYQGIPAEVLAHSELLALVLPMLRADMLVLESYRYLQEPPLECPITCFGGLHDLQLTRGDLDAWRSQTRGPFALRLFPGSHFFIDEHRSAVLEAIAGELRPWTTRRAGQASIPDLRFVR